MTPKETDEILKEVLNKKRYKSVGSNKIDATVDEWFGIKQNWLRGILQDTISLTSLINQQASKKYEEEINKKDKRNRELLNQLAGCSTLESLDDVSKRVAQQKDAEFLEKVKKLKNVFDSNRSFTGDYIKWNLDEIFGEALTSDADKGEELI